MSVVFSSLVAIYSARFKLNEPKRRCRLLTLYLVFRLGLCCSDGFTLNEPKRECEYQSLVLVTVRNEVAKVMFLHLSVILFTGGGLSASVHVGMPPPGPCIPRDQAPPRDHAPPPLRTRYTPAPRDGYCCGWYSYWNAFLLKLYLVHETRLCFRRHSESQHEFFSRVPSAAVIW